MSRIRQLAAFDFYSKSETDGKVVELSPPTDLTAYYNISQVDAQISSGVGGVVDGAPATLDTLREIALSIGNDNDLVGSVTTLLAGKVDDSQVLTNVPSGALFTDTIYTHPTNHSISEVSGLQTALDGKVDDSQVLTNVPSGALFTDTETTTSLSIAANILKYTDEVGGITNLDLSLYLDDTNLAYVQAGTLNGSTGIATFTRSDATTFTVDLSALLDDTSVTVNNTLTSTSTTEALSAAQGKALNTRVLLNDAKVSNVAHPLVETAVPVGALFTDTNTIYSHPATHPASMLTGALPAISGAALTDIDAGTLDGVNSTQFARKDVSNAGDFEVGGIIFGSDLEVSGEVNANTVRGNLVGTFENIAIDDLLQFDGDGSNLTGTGATVSATPPSNPDDGDMWFDTTAGTTSMKVWNGSDWDTMSNKFSATGGTESTYSSGGVTYKVHTFTSSGTFTAEASGSVDVLMVAGGGGGGYQVGGGGGAGGLLYGTTSISAQTYTIIIGNGGGGATSSTTYGVNGGNTTAFSATAIGGGKGGNHNGSCGNVAGGSFTGGSGGGGGAYGGYNGACNTGAPANQGNSGGLTGYGNAGGNGRSGSWCAGGGGGAGGGGYNSPAANIGGDGGAGKQYSISGTATWYAGGGGGSMNNQTSASYYSLGGSGIGGRGFADNGLALTGTNHGDDAAVNTGSGGGGVRDFPYSGGNYTRAGNGSSGIVIVRYAV